MTNPGFLFLTLSIFGGAAAIYAVLYILALLPQLSGATLLPWFVPLSLLWSAACIGWVGVRRLRQGRDIQKTEEKKTVD